MFDGSIIANIVGFSALIISVTALVQRGNLYLLVLTGFALVLWSIHFYLMHSLYGAVIHGIAAAELFVADQIQNAPKRTRLLTGMPFGACYLGACAYWATGEISLMVGVGSAAMSIATLLLRGRKLRVAFMLTECLFLVFALSVGSLPSFMVCIINIGAGVIGLMRYPTEQALTALGSQTLE